ncbi:MAG: hypothetical protein HN948_07185 [Clostridia bacterium]|jgi:hypothetical protein|nr:hypothetical protein [Clostridia bacterium]MBT7122777.1 hypothetical protein [Clostridia bacterium]
MKKIYVNVFIVCLAVLLLLGGCSSKRDEEQKELIVDILGAFSLEDYEFEINEFWRTKSAEEQGATGKIESAEEAAINAERVWLDAYGTEEILRQRPYIVRFDKENDHWLVLGNLWEVQDNSQDDILSSSAYAIIDGEDGRVIAFWQYE